MQDMLHLEEERDYLLYEITDTYPEEVQRILHEYDDIVSKGHTILEIAPVLNMP